MRTACVCLVFICACALTRAADTPAAQKQSLVETAVLSDAVVVARVGLVSAAPASSGGALALWVERALKGRLQRGILWVPRNELPAAEAGPALWLLCLAPGENGYWHIQTGGSASNVLKVDSVNAAPVTEVASYVGPPGHADSAEGPSPAELSRWIEDAGNGSHDTRRAAFAKVLAVGGAARSDLLVAASSSDRNVAAAGRTLLALVSGGPAVNGLRLGLEPDVVTLAPGEKRTIGVNLANVADQDLQVVLGDLQWGSTVLASAAYEVRPQGTPQAARQPALTTVLPKEYGTLLAKGQRPLPLVRAVPRLETTALAVEIHVERATVDGKEQLRLVFPYGYVILDGPGKYALRVRFACPGPRPDQQDLLDAGYWRGGQLVSNAIQLVVQ